LDDDCGDDEEMISVTGPQLHQDHSAGIHTLEDLRSFFAFGFSGLDFHFEVEK
jgi:hypothetical protein